MVIYLADNRCSLLAIYFVGYEHQHCYSADYWCGHGESVGQLPARSVMSAVDYRYTESCTELTTDTVVYWADYRHSDVLSWLQPQWCTQLATDTVMYWTVYRHNGVLSWLRTQWCAELTTDTVMYSTDHRHSDVLSWLQTQWCAQLTTDTVMYSADYR